MTSWRLTVEATAGTREGLIAALEDIAAQFFDDEPFRLHGSVSAEAEVEVRTMQGPVHVTIWSGQATFVSVDG